MLFDYYRRLFVVLMAMLQPFIIYWVCVDIPSISSSWETILQPLFIITNACVSYFFFDLPKWKISSVLLLFLTAFSVSQFKDIHNVLAVLFFISCLFPLFETKRFKFYSALYLMSIPIWSFFGMYWMETWSIEVLCLFHLNMLLYVRKLSLRKDSN